MLISFRELMPGCWCINDENHGHETTTYRGQSPSYMHTLSVNTKIKAHTHARNTDTEMYVIYTRRIDALRSNLLSYDNLPKCMPAWCAVKLDNPHHIF